MIFTPLFATVIAYAESSFLSLWDVSEKRSASSFWSMSFSSALMGLMSVSATFLTALIAFESKGNESGTGNTSFLSAFLGFLGAWWMARRGHSGNRAEGVRV